MSSFTNRFCPTEPFKENIIITKKKQKKHQKYVVLYSASSSSQIKHKTKYDKKDKICE